MDKIAKYMLIVIQSHHSTHNLLTNYQDTWEGLLNISICREFDVILMFEMKNVYNIFFLFRCSDLHLQTITIFIRVSPLSPRQSGSGWLVFYQTAYRLNLNAYFHLLFWSKLEQSHTPAHEQPVTIMVDVLRCVQHGGLRKHLDHKNWDFTIYTF